MDLFFEGLKNGLAMGSIFALMALGYSMVYGIVKMINFAHSEFITVGGFTAYYLSDQILRPKMGNSIIALCISLLIAILVILMIVSLLIPSFFSKISQFLQPIVYNTILMSSTSLFLVKNSEKLFCSRISFHYNILHLHQ